MLLHVLASNPYFTCKGGCGSNTSGDTGLGLAAVALIVYFAFRKKK